MLPFAIPPFSQIIHLVSRTHSRLFRLCSHSYPLHPLLLHHIHRIPYMCFGMCDLANHFLPVCCFKWMKHFNFTQAPHFIAFWIRFDYIRIVYVNGMSTHYTFSMVMPFHLLDLWTQSVCLSDRRFEHWCVLKEYVHQFQCSILQLVKGQFCQIEEPSHLIENRLYNFLECLPTSWIKIGSDFILWCEK